MKVNGHAIRHYRAKRHLTREQLAVDVGVSHETISRVEREDGNVAATTVFLISERLAVPLPALFFDPEKARPSDDDLDAALDGAAA